MSCVGTCNRNRDQDSGMDLDSVVHAALAQPLCPVFQEVPSSQDKVQVRDQVRDKGLLWGMSSRVEVVQVVQTEVMIFEIQTNLLWYMESTTYRKLQGRCQT